MSVDRDEVRRIAELARLDLEDAEADRLTEEMNRILEHAERLRRLDVGGGGAGADGREGADVGPDPAGGFHPAGGFDPADTSDPSSGPGPDAASGPDPLLRPPRAFAPEMIEGFFAVPSPPGVVGDGHGTDREPGPGTDAGASGDGASADDDHGSDQADGASDDGSTEDGRR